MKKIRLTRIMIMEFEPDPEAYPEGSTIEQMAQYETESDDQDLLFSGELMSDKTTWEIIDD